MEVVEQQIMMEFVAASERSMKGKPSSLSVRQVHIVCRQLECCRDELRCRELMAGAHPKVKAALQNLKILLEQERRG